VETIRFYQRRGLLDVPAQSQMHGHGGSIRRYGEGDLRRLRFIRSAATAGFTLEEIGELIALDSTLDRARARAMAQTRIAALERNIAELTAARDALSVWRGIARMGRKAPARSSKPSRPPPATQRLVSTQSFDIEALQQERMKTMMARLWRSTWVLAALCATGTAMAKPGELASIKWPNSAWRFTATQGPDVPDPVMDGDPIPGQIRLCLSKDGGHSCSPALPNLLALSHGPDDTYAEAHYLGDARIVYPRDGSPLLLVGVSSIHAVNNDQRVGFAALTYDKAKDGFTLAYRAQTGRNNNQEIRYMESGPCAARSSGPSRPAMHPSVSGSPSASRARTASIRRPCAIAARPAMATAIRWRRSIPTCPTSCSGWACGIRA
jgi:DNA-binding transcriptional MerR regulator